MEATEFLGGNPVTLSRAYNDRYLKVIWFGIVWENLFRQEQELKQISRAIGATNHSSMFEWKRHWYEMDWRTRHGWLVLFEGFRSTGTPIREGIRDISEFVRENYGEFG